MNPKYCSKKGHHEGRLIEAICLRPECNEDRLLCFYCKHQNHRYHETAYFPKGLPASLETLNKNSSIENSQKQRRKIERKILSIKKGWQGVEQTMRLHMNQIQNKISESHETISNTFLADSVLNIKRKLSTEEIPAAEVEKYVRMINRVNEFGLNNYKKVMAYSKIKERVLEDVFMKAAFQVDEVMKDVDLKSKGLSFTSEDVESYLEEFFDEENGRLKDGSAPIGSGGFFMDEDSDEEFQKRFESQFDETESEMSDLKSQSQIQESDNHSVPQEVQNKENEGLNQPQKDNLPSSGASSLLSSPHTPGKTFKIMIGNTLTGESFEKVHESANEVQQKIFCQGEDQFLLKPAEKLQLKPTERLPLKPTERLQYRNIIKLKNNTLEKDRFELEGFDPNAILCYRKMSFSQENQLDEDEGENIKGETKKKLKLNPEMTVMPQDDERKYLKKRIDNLFKDMLPQDEEIDSESSNVQSVKKSTKMPNKSNDAVYGSFDFSDMVSTKAPIAHKQPTQKHAEPQKQSRQEIANQIQIEPKPKEPPFIDERFIQIHRKVIKLPDESRPTKNQTNLVYPNVKIYGHTLGQIYESLLMLDASVITKLQVYCDTTTLCLDSECVEVIITMKKLKSLMVYMTYQMRRCDVKKIITNLSSLEELVLSEYNKMDQDLAKLVRDRLPNLRRFFYTVDERNYMQKIEENLEFFIDFKMTSTSLEVIEILSDIPLLQTIEIINVNNKIAGRIPNVLKKMKNLKEVCIKNTNNSQSNSTDIVAFLASSNVMLEVFCAHNTTFKEESLVKIIEKNKKLHTLIINECLQLRNETMSVLSKNCPNLKQLSLMLIDSINGREICAFTQLKTLVLRGCWQIDHQYFLKNIHKLSELEFLSVSLNNYWFYDHFMDEVVKLTKLKFLNLDTTKVSDVGIKDLHKLKQLETLICGKTEVTFQRLIKSLKGPYANSKNWTIRKLGLSKDESYSKQVKTKGSKNKHDLQITDFEAKNLIPLGKALPGLTHLSIGGFVDPKKEYFKTLTNLKCLFVTKKQLASETENWLVEKGVYINEDY